LDRIFRLESPRTIYNDWVVRYENRYFQLERQNRNYAPARSQVLVCESRHGKISIEYRGRELEWREIPAPAKPCELAVPPGQKLKGATPKRKWVPPADHPWRKLILRTAQQKEAGREAR
jgi:hypothetical protein